MKSKLLTVLKWIGIGIAAIIFLGWLGESREVYPFLALSGLIFYAWYDLVARIDRLRADILRYLEHLKSVR